MKFNLDENLDNVSVSSYSEDWICVGDRRIEEPCVISSNGIDLGILPAELSELNFTHFTKLLDQAPEIILLGTGRHQVFPDYDLIRQLAAENIALEVMDTGAACRSYNILLAESRVVAAALYIK